MAGRTQCEGEEIHRKAASEARYIAGAVTVGGKAYDKLVTAPMPAPVKVAQWAVFGTMTAISFFAEQKANKLAVGCRREHYEQGKKDAAAAANGTAGGGSTGDHHHGVEHGRHLTCQEVYITTGAPAATNSRGDIIISGGYWAT